MADADDGDPPSAADAELLRALGGALGPEPVPEGLIERAVELLVVVDLEPELVALLQQAATDSEVAGTRGDADTDVSSLVFVSSDGTITIEIEFDQHAVSGQLIGAHAVAVTLERMSEAPVDTPVDTLGRFRFTGLPPGPARLRVRVADTSVTTDWFVL